MSDYDLNTVAEVAASLAAQPKLHQVYESQFPDTYKQILKLLDSPFYRWYPFKDRNNEPNAQFGFCQSRHKNKWCTAGNRGGKTISGLMEDVADCLMLDVITKRPSDKYQQPPQMWIVSDTEETAINVIERGIVTDVLGSDESGFLWNFIRDEASYSEKGGFADHIIPWTNGATIQTKFSTQKRNTFQGRKLDKVHHDEVQPRDIYGECVARLADRNGYFLGTMTPIYDEKRGGGIPWIYEELYLQKTKKNIEFHNWSMLDNPYIPQEAKDRLLDQWDEDEIDARVYGQFVPMGVKLAFPTKLIRKVRNYTSDSRFDGHLTLADGRVSFVEQIDADYELASVGQTPS